MQLVLPVSTTRGNQSHAPRGDKEQEHDFPTLRLPSAGPDRRHGASDPSCLGSGPYGPRRARRRDGRSVRRAQRLRAASSHPHIFNAPVRRKSGRPMSRRTARIHRISPMSNILLLTSSPRGAASHSNRVAARVLDELRRANPDTRVIVRDLAKNPIRHIDDDFVTGIFAAADRLNTEQRERLAQSDILIDELLAADIVVIAVAMINFGVPSTLKAWIDHVTRAGRTFQYGESGPRG